MTTPSVQIQRDNLNIGLFLAGNPYGVELDRILQGALGYNPDMLDSENYRDLYANRFRAAQRVGRDAFRDRKPGYFTFNAQPFGWTHVYKAIWYVWVNPQTRKPQTVLMPSVDLRRMREYRDKDLDTRAATSRSVRTAHDIEDEKKALGRGDSQDLQSIQRRMVEDDSLGEILSGLCGVPFADIKEVLPQLPDAAFGNVRYEFQTTARKINRLQGQLRRELARVSDQLTNWVTLRTGLPRNASQLALQDAESRLSSMRG